MTFPQISICFPQVIISNCSNYLHDRITFENKTSKERRCPEIADLNLALGCHRITGAGGKPSTWFPPGGLVEHTRSKQKTQRAHPKRNNKQSYKQVKCEHTPCVVRCVWRVDLSVVCCVSCVVCCEWCVVRCVLCVGCCVLCVVCCVLCVVSGVLCVACVTCVAWWVVGVVRWVLLVLRMTCLLIGR